MRSRYRKTVLYDNGDYEITLHEVIFALIIFSIFTALGLFIGNLIQTRNDDKSLKYNTAVDIDNNEIFQYALDTDVPNIFVYGDLIAVDPVTNPELSGEYMKIKKDTERYTRHTRTVTTIVNKKPITRTVVYWTWDRIKTEEYNVNTVTYCGIPLDFIIFSHIDTFHNCTVSSGYNLRHVYYTTPTTLTGTTFFQISDHEISNKPTQFYNNKNIEKVRKDIAFSDRLKVILFYILWFMFLIGGIIVFFIHNNDSWLEDMK